MGFIKHLTSAIALTLAICGTTRAAEPLKIRLAWSVPLTTYGSILFEKKDVFRDCPGEC